MAPENQPLKKRRFLLETIIFRFRVKLLGCMSVVPMKGINTKGRFLNTSGLFFVFVCIFNLKYDGITILLPLSCSSICRRHTLHIYVYIYIYIYIIPYTLGLFNVPHGSIVFFFSVGMFFTPLDDSTRFYWKVPFPQRWTYWLVVVCNPSEKICASQN